MTFDLRCSCAVDLIEPQLTVMLQLVQLWSVLSRLAQPPGDEVDLHASNTTMKEVEGAGPQGDQGSFVPCRRQAMSSFWSHFS